MLLAGTAVMLLFGAKTRPSGRLFLSLLLLSVLSLAVSTALSSNRALSLYGTNWRRFGAVTQTAALLFAWLVACHTSGRPERTRTIVRGVVAAGMVASAYGIAQYFGWDPILPAAGYHVGEGVWSIVRPPGTLGHASYFATWLLFTVFLSVTLASMETRAAWRWLALGAAAMALAAMLLTGTRAAILGFLTGGVVWPWRSGVRPNRRVAAAAAAIVLAAIGFYYSPPGQQLRSRARWFAEDPRGGARLPLWRDSLRMAMSRPAAGFGPEVFTAQFPAFESKELARAYPDFEYESPHNMFLDALVAQGIPGFLLLGALSAAGVWAAWRLARAYAGVAAALVAGIVCQQFTVFTLPTALIFYTALALAVGLGPAAAPRRPRNAVFTPCAVLAALALVYLAARLTAADWELERARQSLGAGDVQRAALEYRQHLRWRLPGAGSDLWYSRACAALAQQTPNPAVRLQAISEAGPAALRATHTAEDPCNAWYSLSALYGAMNDAAGAEKSLRAAIAARPRWFKPHWVLAQVLSVGNRMEEARREARIAVSLDGGKHPEVAQTLAVIDARLAAAKKVLQE